MKLVFKISLTVALFLVVYSCDKKEAAPEIAEEQRQKIEMITDRGTMVIELYNETPLHRDNFLKLANESTYDSVLFHRVIDSFMITYFLMILSHLPDSSGPPGPPAGLRGWSRSGRTLDGQRESQTNI